MTICNVLSTMKVGNNTAVIVDGSGEMFRNGMCILDDSGRPYEVLSVGMDVIVDTNEILKKTSLLVKGVFTSKGIFV